MWFCKLEPVYQFAGNARAEVYEPVQGSYNTTEGCYLLVDIKQREGESLISYPTRFNKIATELKRLDENLVLMAIMDGVNKRTEFSH